MWRPIKVRKPVWSPLFSGVLFSSWRLVSSPVLSQRKWATRKKKRTFHRQLKKTDEDQWRRCPVAGARSGLPVIPPCIAGTNWRGPSGEHRSKGYVPHTYLYIASRVVGVGTGQAVHVTGLASRRWAILTTGRPGKAIPWKRTAVGGRWLAGSQQLWPVPREPPGPPVPRSVGPLLGDRSWSVTMSGVLTDLFTPLV
jgi:hypothetical protein